jgi:hypothetical protein
MKENAKTGSRYTVERENLGVEAGTTATSTSGAEAPDTNLCRQRTNNIIEAYTGNDAGHKEDRTS